MSNDKYWEKHELETLIAHHEQQAKEQRETAEMFTEEGDEEDRRSFMKFVAMRELRAAELKRRLAAM